MTEFSSQNCIELLFVEEIVSVLVGNTGQVLWLLNLMFPCAQLKGSDLEITLTRGSSKPGPACAYVNLNICTNGSEQGKSI